MEHKEGRETTGDPRALAYAALQGLRQPLLVIDRNCRVRLRNSAAQEVLARGNVLAVEGDRVACAEPASARRFARVLDEVLQQHLPCRSLRLASAAGAGEITASLRLLEGCDFPEPLAVLSLFPPGACAETHASVLASTFEFTPAEARIATYLARGLAMKEIARQVGVAVSTVRSHTQGLFEKTGTHRQADLVRQLLLASTL